LNILLFISMPFYSPLAFLRLYYNKQYFYVFLSLFPSLTYFFILSTLFNILDIPVNFLFLIFITLIFVFVFFIENSMLFSLISSKVKELEFKKVCAINSVSFWPFFLFLPVVNLFKDFLGLDFIFFIIPFFVVSFLRNKYFFRIFKYKTRIFLYFFLIKVLVILSLIALISLVTISGIGIFIKTLTSLF